MAKPASAADAFYDASTKRRLAQIEKKFLLLERAARREIAQLDTMIKLASVVKFDTAQLYKSANVAMKALIDIDKSIDDILREAQKTAKTLTPEQRATAAKSIQKAVDKLEKRPLKTLEAKSAQLLKHAFKVDKSTIIPSGNAFNGLLSLLVALHKRYKASGRKIGKVSKTLR